MTAKPYFVFNTYDDEGNDKKYIFYKYTDGDLPEDCGCVYIFAKTYTDNISVAENKHIESVERLSMIFDKVNIGGKLKKYHSNSLLIYECCDPDKMDNIVRWIRKSHNID
jgi:hypothetical protein